MATITAGDYTVEYTIPKDIYYNWYQNFYKANGARASPAFTLKLYMIERIEAFLNEDLAEKNNAEGQGQSQAGGKKQRKKTDDHEMTEVKIADITFSFNNSELIKELQNRGAAIAA